MTICYVILSAIAKSFSKSVKATRAELNNMSTPSTVHASLVLLVQVNCKCVMVSFWRENQAAITSFARSFDKIVPCCCFVVRKEKQHLKDLLFQSELRYKGCFAATSQIKCLSCFNQQQLQIETSYSNVGLLWEAKRSVANKPADKHCQQHLQIRSTPE